MEERGFYVRLVCNKGEGVAVLLFRALESLSSFNVQNSNLATASERFILTFTLNVSFLLPLINYHLVFPFFFDYYMLLIHGLID